MSHGAQQLINWWRGRAGWVRVVLLLALLPLVPAIVIAARFGDASGGKAATAVASIVGLVIYAGAATSDDGDADTTAVTEATAEARPDASATPSPSPSPSSTPTPTTDPTEQLQAEVMDALGDLQSDVATIEVEPATGAVTVSTRLPWSHETDTELAMALCKAVLDGPGRTVTVAAASGEELATGTSAGCEGPDRLPIGDSETLLASLQSEHGEVSGMEADDTRVVVTTNQTLAWDTPLDSAEAICDQMAAEAGDGWRVVVQDASGRSMATGTSDDCQARDPLPSPEPEPEPEPVETSAPAPEPESEPVAPPPSNDCHPSYTGGCVPADASDVDCAGGSGNGPAYTGRVNVVGPDVYGLDRDGDGVACE